MNEAEYVRILELVHTVFTGRKRQEALDELAKMAKTVPMDPTDYLVTASERFNLHRNTDSDPEPTITPPPKIVTIPGTLGEIFDRWIAAGYDASNVTDETHPDGQERALEAMRGYNWRNKPSPKPVLRDQTKAWLSKPENEGRASYFDMLEGKYNKWSRNRR